MYINISCICENNIGGHNKFGQQLFGLPLEGEILIMKLGLVGLDINISTMYTKC